MAATRGRRKKIEQTDAQAVMSAVKELDINKVVSDVGSLQVSVQSTLAKLSAELTNKLQQMDQVGTAISIKEDRLKELFDIEKESLNIEDIKSKKEQEEKDFNEKVAEREKLWKEQDSERAKAWLRSKEDHDYAVRVSNQRAKDEFDNEMATIQRNEAIRQEALNKSWKDREESIKSKEKEFSEMESKIANFDTVLNNAVTKAKEETELAVNKEYEYSINLVRRETEGELKLRDQKISAQEAVIASLRKQMDQLNQHLDAARRDAKDVANQALQSASGRQVAEALQKVVSDRDTNTKSK